jgi:hypothetical protein
MKMHRGERRGAGIGLERGQRSFRERAGGDGSAGGVGDGRWITRVLGDLCAERDLSRGFDATQFGSVSFIQTC